MFSVASSSRRAAGVAVAVLVISWQGGCGDAGRVAVKADVKGGLYVATHSDRFVLARDREGSRRDATLSFGDGRVTGSGGCNQSVAALYSLVGGVLKVSDLPEAVAGVGCLEGIVMAQDDWLNGLVHDRPKVRIKDGGRKLELSTNDDTVTFELRRRRPVLPEQRIEQLEAGVASSVADTNSTIRAIRAQAKSGKITAKQKRSRIRAASQATRKQIDKAVAELNAGSQ